MATNPMRAIRLEKVTLNISVGDDREKVEKAKSMLEQLTGKTVVITATRKRSTFGVAKGRPIGAKTTLRGAAAAEVLKRCLQAKENVLRPSVFDAQGNFSFGIEEYIDIPGIKYDPDIGIIGLDVTVTLERPGYRIARRRLRKRPVGKKHRITPEEARAWAEKELGVTVKAKE